METAAFEPSMLLAILPEIGLVVLALTLLVFDLVWKDQRCGRLGLYTAAGVTVLAILSIIFSRPAAEPQLIFGGMLRLDAAGFVFRMIFLIGAGLTALFAIKQDDLCLHGEFYVLMLISTLGLCLMASSADIIMLYLSIETASIPLYALAGFLIRDKKSVEAGIKYLLFGAMTSAVMLYGFSLMYGFTGTTQLYQLAQGFEAGNVPFLPLAAASLMVLVGFGFKVSAVPFHFWAPDVYEGSATPVAAFLSTASKAAGFAVLLRVLLALFPSHVGQIWPVTIAILSGVSMIVGNLLAMNQKNIKRLLAYSSIAQAGYILIGVAAGTEIGISAAIYYLMSYLVTNMAAFGLVAIVGQAVGSDDLDAYAGLSRRAPLLGLVMLVSLLSLGGVPPFAGFFGKLWVFGAAVESGMAWLAILGALNSVAALYYYLRVLKVVYLDRSPDEKLSFKLVPPWVFALVVCVAGILVLGFLFAPWYGWATQAAQAFAFLN